MLLPTFGRLEWQLFRNRWLKNQRGLIWLAVLGLVFAAMASLIISAFSAARGVGLEVVYSLCAVMIPSITVFSLLQGVPGVFNTFFSSGDLGALFALPVKTSTIYLTKFVGAVARNLLGPGVALVLLLGLGNAAGLPAIYYVIAVGTAAGMALLSTAIAAFLTMALVEVFPGARVRNIIGVLTALTGLIFALSAQIPGIMESRGGTGALITGLTRYAGFAPWWLPTTPAVLALKAAAQGMWTSLPYLLAFLLISSAVLWLSTSLVERGFRMGALRLTEGVSGKVRASKGAQLSRPSWQSITVKEIKTVWRNPVILMSVLPLFLVFGLVLYQMMNDGGLMTMAPELRWIVLTMILLLFGSTAVGQIALGSVGREGEAPGVLASLPVSGWTIAWGKFWGAYVSTPLFMVVLEVALGVYFRWPAQQMIMGSLAVTLVSAGYTAICLALSAFGARWDPRYRGKTVTTGVSFLNLIIGYLYIAGAAIVAALLMIPAQMEPVFSEWVMQMSPGFWRGVVAILAAYLGLNPLVRYSIGAGLAALYVGGVTLLSIKVCGQRLDKGITVRAARMF
jgi:ABC-2 type transport system permease protein